MGEQDKITIDVVVPSIRLDTERLLGALRMNVPSGVEVRYYVVSDNPDLKPVKTLHNGSPVLVMVNKENLGAPLSRNVGLEAGSGRYVLFIDDDVKISPDMLVPYLEAIDRDPNAPGYVGPTLFPDPVNSFTRGIVTSDILTFFELPTNPRLMSWGTTSNLMVRRSAVGDVRFSAVFPRHGGGEDIDFCLRVAANVGRWFETVPDAAVRHPWWGGGSRSYKRFFRWSFGDSRLTRLHPEYAYWDVPNMVGTLVFGAAIMGCLAIAGLIPPFTVGIWAGLAAGAEFAVDQVRIHLRHPQSSVGDVLEATMICISNYAGKFFGNLSRGDMQHVFKKFDYEGTGEWKPGDMKFSRAKFALFSASVPLAYWLGLLWT